MNPIRLVPAALGLGLAVVSLAPAPARAESYHTCAGFIDALPAVLSTQGTWCLRHDVTTALATGKAIEITVNNVTIDCNGFKIGGLAAGESTETSGVHALNRLNATVRNCGIRGFASGVSLLGTGGGHLVEDNRFDGNTVVGAEVHGDGSRVRRNGVFDSGGTTRQNVVFGIASLGAVDIRDNVVDGVSTNPLFDNGSAFAVTAFHNDRGTIVGNRIGGLQSVGTGFTRGVHTVNSGTMTVRDNILVGDNRTGGVGINCTNGDGLALDNVVMKFPTQAVGCTEVGTTP